jgi:hypothetical protein
VAEGVALLGGHADLLRGEIGGGEVRRVGLEEDAEAGGRVGGAGLAESSDNFSRVDVRGIRDDARYADVEVWEVREESVGKFRRIGEAVASSRGQDWEHDSQ